MSDRWIIIPNWFGQDDPNAGLQHYKDRDPKWIKNYRRLLSKDEYRDLSGQCRAILHGVWLEYASTDGRLRADAHSLSSRLALRVNSKHIEALNHAGFIELTASKPLAISEHIATLEKRQRERREEKEEDQEHALSKPTGKNGHEYDNLDTPTFALLHLAVGPTEENLEKLRRAARGLPTAAIVQAREAAQGPGVNDPLAVALAELKKARA